ncbi:MAG: Ppx/GppA phosphatase family protein [Fusobacteria bacterium]|nr:Ppx/GppA phosphatase family protein [Fusobacteriota bacterium]
MKRERVASIDIGTNSVRLLVADREDYKIIQVEKRKVVTRLGKNLSSTGLLSEESMDNTLEALKLFAKRASEHGVKSENIVCLATSASRDAQNGEEFMKKIGIVVGIKPQIIPGEIEAQLAFAGATCDRDINRKYLVVDIGGGSTEFAYGTPEILELVESLNMGAVRLKELFFASDEYEEETIEKAKIFISGLMSDIVEIKGEPYEVIGVAGTITTQVTIRDSIDKEVGYVHLKMLTKNEVKDNFNRLKKMSLTERESIIGLEKERADVIVVGTLILLTLMEVLGIEEMRVSESDNLEGMQLLDFSEEK